mgnify:FL=1
MGAADHQIDAVMRTETQEVNITRNMDMLTAKFVDSGYQETWTMLTSREKCDKKY